MNIFNYIVIVILILTSCEQTHDRGSNSQLKADNYPDTSYHITKKVEDFGGIRILNTGPKGGAYQSANGNNFRYTVFRVQIFNDTIIPIDLDINFPSAPIGLLPDSSLVFEVFLVPDKFTPHSIQENFNFGTKLEELFGSESNYQFDLTTSIHPNDHLILYIGILLKSKVIDGTTRAKLFVKDQDHDAPFFAVTSNNKYKLNNSPIYLVYGISIDPPNHHTLIPCGQALFDN